MQDIVDINVVSAEDMSNSSFLITGLDSIPGTENESPEGAEGTEVDSEGATCGEVDDKRNWAAEWTSCIG